MVGIEYPKRHDVSAVLVREQARFPAWFASEIPEFATASKALAGRREISMYGDEERSISPDNLITVHEVEKAWVWARKAVEAGQRLIGPVKRSGEEAGREYRELGQDPWTYVGEDHAG